MKHKFISKKDRQGLAELTALLSKHPELTSLLKETAVVAQNKEKVLDFSSNKKKHETSKKPRKEQAEMLTEKKLGACKINSLANDVLELSIQVDLTGSMLEMESKIQAACNALGNAATGKALEHFDTDGSPIRVAGIKLTTKGKVAQKYQTPYGEVNLERHVYQTSKGGKQYCPLKKNARLIQDATPMFAKTLASKYAKESAEDAVRDLNDNHGRKIAKCYVQNVAETVSKVVEEKEESWSYDIPEKKEVAVIALSMDGANVLMDKEGYREAMVGTASFYNKEGERSYTIRLGATPEYGKGVFKEKMVNEIERIKSLYPNVLYIGIADGAKDNWTFLANHTKIQILDFYHVTEYLTAAAEVLFSGKKQEKEQKEWLTQTCSNLKHKKNFAKIILNELKKVSSKKKLSTEKKEKLEKVITYLKNNLHKMNYSDYVDKNFPIGSGVTEAACKTLIKQRFCCSGMRWKNAGMKVVLNLRSLIQTEGRWDQFWKKIDQYGID